jgi:hypothetical protein
MSNRLGILALTLLAASFNVTAAELKTYDGFLVIGPEVEVFRPCGSKTYLWLDYDPTTSEPMMKRYRELATKPYEETYAVLVGSIGPKLDCGFCDHYDGSFRVAKFLEQRRATTTVCKQ